MDGPITIGGVRALIDRMEAYPNALRALIAGMSEDGLRWSPEDGVWSVLEVLCHLADEEEADFSVRLRLIIASPDQQWPPIDPMGWAVERRYREQDPHEAIDRFTRLRSGHLPWLRTLTVEDLASVHEHPRFGPVPASWMLGAWSAHDALHLRQIARRLHGMSSVDLSGANTIYAGEW